MDEWYVLGLATALGSGCATAAGLLLMKSAIVRLSPAQREGRYFRSLLRTPRWLAGFALAGILASVLFVAAELLIGPSLVPGVNAIYLVLLAAGSVKLIGEHLTRGEVAGIGAMVAGIFLLGLSELAVPADTLEILGGALLGNALAYSGVLLGLWAVLLARAVARDPKNGILLGMSAGCLYGASDIWLFITLVAGGRMLAGIAADGGLLLGCGIAFVVATNVLAAASLLHAYRIAPISKVQPLQETPSQVSPLFGYLFVFQRPALALQLGLGVAGICLIIAATVALGRRKGELKGLKVPPPELAPPSVLNDLK